MHASNSPAVASLIRNSIDRRQGPGNLGHVVECHGRAGSYLSEEGREDQTTEAVENIYMRWHILCADVFEDFPDSKPVVDPTVQRLNTCLQEAPTNRPNPQAAVNGAIKAVTYASRARM